MTSQMALANASQGAREIYNKYLKYHQGEAFLFKKGEESKKQYLWVAVAKDEYTTAEVITENSAKFIVRTPKGDEVEIEKDKADFVNPPKFDGVEDCAELSYLSEAAVLHNLRKRYEADIIYVSLYVIELFIDCYYCRLILVFS